MTLYISYPVSCGTVCSKCVLTVSPPSLSPSPPSLPSLPDSSLPPSPPPSLLPSPPPSLPPSFPPSLPPRLLPSPPPSLLHSLPPSLPCPSLLQCLSPKPDSRTDDVARSTVLIARDVQQIDSDGGFLLLSDEAE